MILSKNRQSDDILFVDASHSYKKEKKQNVLTESDIQRIFDTVTARKDVPNYAHLASMEEIKANDYNLNVPRYISAGEGETPYDLFSVMTGQVSDGELQAFEKIWKQFPALRSKLLSETGSYYKFNDVSVRETVFSDEDVKICLDGFKNTSEHFRTYLVNTLISHDVTPEAYHEIAQKIFDQYKDYELIDAYKVFQSFVDNWSGIDSDLARIESEGWQICSETEPNMVTKKDSKTKKTVEEQKGWKGKVIPFDLVKSVFFADDFDKMSQLNAAADAKASEYADIWENMDEEAKVIVCKDDDESAFDTKTFKAAMKSGDLDADAVKSLKDIQDAIAEEKSLRKEVKTIEADLEEKAKVKVENLAEEEIYVLLQKKWIDPIVRDINGVAESVIAKFVSDFETVKKKYGNPLSELSEGIEKTTAALKSSFNDLTGNDTDVAAIKMLMEEL